MFDEFDATAYEDEARERRGHTDAYRESARRAKSYGDHERVAPGLAAYVRAAILANADAQERATAVSPRS